MKKVFRCWSRECDEVFDSGDARREHWEYVHAGLESDGSIPRVSRAEGRTFSLIRSYKGLEKTGATK